MSSYEWEAVEIAARGLREAQRKLDNPALERVGVEAEIRVARDRFRRAFDLFAPGWSERRPS